MPYQLRQFFGIPSVISEVITKQVQSNHEGCPKRYRRNTEEPPKKGEEVPKNYRRIAEEMQRSTEENAKDEAMDLKGRSISNPYYKRLKSSILSING